MSEVQALRVTHLPVRNDDQAPPVPRSSLGRPTADDRFVHGGSWVAGFALAWLICERLLPLHGIAWLLVVGFGCGLAVLAVTTAMTGSANEVRDRLASAMITSGAGRGWSGSRC